MYVTYWYCVALAASSLLLALWRLARSTRLRFSIHDRHYILSRIRSFLLRVVLPRAFLGSLNFLDILFIALFFIGSGLATSLSLYGLGQLRHRAATLGSINLLPVFIGRRIYTSNLVGASARTYRLIHACFAIVGIVQAALHSGLTAHLATRSSIQDPYVFYTGLAVRLAAKDEVCALTSQGIVFLVLPALISPFLLLPLRPRRLVRGTHLALGLLSLPMLCCHIALTSQAGKIVVGICVGLWTASVVYTWLHAHLYGTGEVQTVVELTGASIVHVRTTKQIRPYAGCYYYIAHSAFSLAVDSPQIVFHWTAGAKNEGSDLFLLLEGHHAHIKSHAQVLLDGPYGLNTHPEKYETVVLVAQGRGIAGLLPAAMQIARIGRHDRITRRIDLQWKLDHHDQEEWVEERLQNLIQLDPHRSLFAAHLYYPRLRVRSLKNLNIPEKHSKQWNTFRLSHDECMNRIRRNIDSKSRYAGHMTVLACGDQEFTAEIQSYVFHLPTMAKFASIDLNSGGKRLSPQDISHIPGTLA
ncbi:Putative ferric reductase, NAD binding domain-containing protein [Colletotrichum destructivum]|uniref:Ferric reductase, NAD binding domain-containing protein n=1 Tax=Colletotrichum destructivum TaxID=34406 RepID=A0AAX4J1W9_9PEZI|nr:Putative ferric reductase, NAD binding domain-containing protein [Colletotrichum destructivum]